MENPIVKIEQGQLRGVAEKNFNGKNYFAFRGIPYAKPPLGNLRFKDPELPERWFGVRDAFNFGDQCAQRDLMTCKMFGSEDCLYLNVYTPTLNSLVPKAVMVWIHGGAFLCGSGNDDIFGPEYLIEKDIVLITMNYRLGILGFLNADDEEAPGNQGLKDQVQALKWIQKNITRFDGDPNNVTICGGSAGGSSVHYLTISPLAQGLFHKAVIHSGTALNPWARPSKPPIETVKKLANLLGKNMSNVKEFIGYLRTLEPFELIKAENKIQTFEELEKWLNESTAGVVYFTLGSMVNIETFSEETLKAFYSTFRKIAPVRVLMRIANKENLLPGLPDNVRISSWIPQIAVLSKYRCYNIFISINN
ncbi:hypothetical protein PV327_008903 [Microctonus hyperodae]|uniref:Carboxylesterase type B domain-containing protein n=1 Tax=Microctonus hyperodae TaxID=165561 RepID=A0AA39FSN8_MICHY|nr:hypothetical protein PV327_008903 [Microctonus hyperodae]